MQVGDLAQCAGLTQPNRAVVIPVGEGGSLGGKGVADHPSSCGVKNGGEGARPVRCCCKVWSRGFGLGGEQWRVGQRYFEGRVVRMYMAKGHGG